MQLSAGDALGAQYRLAERIGAGAAGDVWRAESADGTSFAAKILKAEHTQDADLVARFIRERSVLIGLRHPSIVAIRDLVVEGDTLAIVMDFVQGGSMRDLLEERGTLPAVEALDLCAQVFDGLAFAHDKGVMHRDIKPDNVLLTGNWKPDADGTVRVTDFGIASVVSERKSQTTGLLGTPQYMSPELISHGKSSGASDVYSTGVMLYELLAGQTPFAGPGTDFTIAYRHVSAVPPPLDVPPSLWSLLEALLDKDPAARPTGREAAAMARKLAKEHAKLAPLARATPVESFEELERPATMLRSDLLKKEVPEDTYVSSLPLEAPELGEAGQQTIVRPMQRPTFTAAAEEVSETAAPKKTWGPDWLTPRMLALGGAGTVVLIGVVVAGAFLFTGGEAKTEAAAGDAATSATQRDQALLTGLATSRQAKYDAAAKTVSIEFTFGAQKAPLTGDLLEVLPVVGKAKACAPVVWEGAKGERHQASTTGMSVDCGWKLENVEVPKDGELTVTATMPAEFADDAALSEWLESAAAATTEAVSATDVVSTAYPIQCLQDVQMVTPYRTVSQTPIEITLLPVWPSGADEMNPLYRSPATGKPSTMLTSIAGGEENVRFSDNCSGAVAVSSDGLVVTALSTTSNCNIQAKVGNFTDVQGPPLSITTRE